MKCKLDTAIELCYHFVVPHLITLCWDALIKIALNYLSKRMLHIGTSDDAQVSTVVNMPTGQDNKTFLSWPSYP
jgi:hypothetical protein